MSNFERGIQDHMNRIARTFNSITLSVFEKIAILLSLFVNKSLLNTTLAELEPEKTVAISGRVFHLVNDFKTRNNNYIDSKNLILIYLNQPLDIRTFGELHWFEALVVCFARGLLPTNLDMDIYRSFAKKELNKLIKGELVNILETRNDIGYMSNFESTSASHLIKCYNLLHPNLIWGKSAVNTTSREIQVALGVNNPIKLNYSTENTIIYLRSRFNMNIPDCIKDQDIFSKAPWLVPPPRNLNDIYKLQRKGLIERFNSERESEYQYLITNSENIVETTPTGSRSALAISKKIKCMYKFKNIEHLTPKGVTNKAPLNLLEDELEYIKSV